jgi:hypothetical protein
MSRPAMRIFGIAAMLACTAFGAAGPVVTTEELFRWGEYDSLIRALEPLAEAPGFATGAATRADSADRARSLLYLGVAYYAKGRTDRADPAFRLACALDSGVELDKFYVTQAIAAHFNDVKSEDRRGREDRDALDRARRGPGATQAPPAGGSPDRSARTAREARFARKGDHDWLWWGLGAAAMAAAGGGAYWYASRPSGPQESVTILDIRENR